MFRLILIAVASALMLAQAPAHETKHTSSSDKVRPQTAWASSKAASAPANTIVGENCYVEREPAIDDAGRAYLRAEVICD